MCSDCSTLGQNRDRFTTIQQVLCYIFCIAELTEVLATAAQNYEYFKKTRIPFADLLGVRENGFEAFEGPFDLAMRLRDSHHLSGEQDPIRRQHEAITEWRQSLKTSHRTKWVVLDTWNEGGHNFIWTLPTKELQLFGFRILVALSGGLSLVIPMLIMSIEPNLTKSLVTTSAFVIAFGVGMATFVPQSEYKDLLASTAAYAAVLVVFVGVNGVNGAG